MKETEKKLKEENTDLKSRLLRTLADYDNLQKRSEIERVQSGKRASLNLLREFLPLLDLITKAQENLKDPALDLVKNTFEEIFKKEDLEKFGEVGEDFDPTFHEVIAVVPGGKENQIAEVITPGYKFEDLVLRPAMVKVYRNDKN